MSSEAEGRSEDAARAKEQRLIYGDFDAFLKHAIKEYYDRGWRNRRGNFVALLIASGQTLEMAKDSVSSGDGIRNVAVGAGAMLALRIGLRYALGGPLGLILGAATAVSLAQYFIRNRKDVTKKIDVYKKLIQDARGRYDELQGAHRGGRTDVVERNLMIDGLMKRFLEDCDSK